jgi:pimeloyl-ACP methyl ester carboxylesterase
MAMIHVNGTSLYYEDTGGVASPVVFSHGLLWNTELFAPQIAVLKDRYRCIAYDHRGQGKSADGTGRAVDMATVTDDAAALIEALGLGPVHFCGLSMGGIVGMRLAIDRPDLIRSLVLLDTTADPEPSKLKYKAMNVIVRLFGMGPVVKAIMPALFGKTALADPARAAERSAWQKQLAANRRSIWRSADPCRRWRRGCGHLAGTECAHCASDRRREFRDYPARRSWLDLGAARRGHGRNRRIS